MSIALRRITLRCSLSEETTRPICALKCQQDVSISISPLVDSSGIQEKFNVESSSPPSSSLYTVSLAREIIQDD